MKTSEEIIRGCRICGSDDVTCDGCPYVNAKPCLRLLLNDAGAEIMRKDALLNIEREENERLKKRLAALEGEESV